MLTTLRAARLARGMSQTEAGALIGLGQSHYGKIERAQVQLWAVDALALCEAFGLTLSQLLTNDPESR